MARDLTAERLQQVHVAMEAAGKSKGTVSRAAKLLQISSSVLNRYIRDYPELRSYLPNAQPPTEMQVYAKEAPPARLNTDIEAETAEMVKKVDEQVRKGFAAIGVEGDSLEQAMAFRDFGKFHFEGIRQFTTGGLAKLYADMMADIHRLRHDIEQAGGEDLDLQKMLREDRCNLVRLEIQIFQELRESYATSAAIEARKKMISEANNKKRPGFGPLQPQAPAIAMKVEGNVTVNDGKR